MDLPDLPTVAALMSQAAAAAASLRSVVESVRALKSGAGGTEGPAATESLSAVLDQVVAAQAAVLQFQEMALRLRSEVAELEHKLLQSQQEKDRLTEQVREKEEWALDRKRYRLKTLKVGAAVRVRDDTPGVFYCATCFEVNRQAIPFQPNPQAALKGLARLGTHYCPVCTTRIFVALDDGPR